MKNSLNGIIVVNKEKEYTSRDVVNVLSKHFQMKKVGHTGTLDPLATGVLVVAFGKYTKLVDKITAYEKEYIATIKLGMETDTLDITGEVLETKEPRVIEKEELVTTLHSFLGKSMQEVPKYAAVRVNGKRLYEYARSGEAVELPSREIQISDIELLTYENDEITFRVVVSKGTYIRSLIRDICREFHVLGTMSELTRTRQGQFTLDEANTLQDIQNGYYKLLTVKDVFDYPSYSLNHEEYQKVKNGVPLKLKQDDPFLIMEYRNEVLAIYQNKEECYKSYFML